jgi:hypothetical protein
MDIVFIETPEFVEKIDKIANSDDFFRLQKELLVSPQKGKIERGTGGARKIRMGLKGRGKSGGARVIYYYLDLRGEIWFLDTYQKKDKQSLTDKEKAQLFRFIKEVINAEE